MNNFELYLTNYFKKEFSKITNEDLNKIEEISLDGINIYGLKEDVELNKIISMLPNLKKIHFNNMIFNGADIELLSNTSINYYDFYNCKLDSNSMKLLNNVVYLCIERCTFDNYSFLNNQFNNLLSLSIIEPRDEETIDLSIMNALNLKELVLQECLIKNIESIQKFKNCELLNILWSSYEKVDFSWLNDLSCLKELFISKEKCDLNIINMLKEKNIKIYHDLNKYSTYLD